MTIIMFLLGILTQLGFLIDSIKEKRINYFNVFQLLFFIFTLIHYLYNNNEFDYRLEPIIHIDMIVYSIYYTIKCFSIKKAKD